MKVWVKRLIEALVDRLIWTAERTPYFDIHNEADGSLYMGRDWLMPAWLLAYDHQEKALKPKRWLPFALRLHHIARPDLDRAFHDHPSTFISLVLRGGYAELRPTSAVPNWRDGGEEDGYTITRLPGSIAMRRYTDRHRIVSVLPDTRTLVLWFRKRQSWGFFTPAGKIHWRDYASVHNTAPREPA